LEALLAEGDECRRLIHDEMAKMFEVKEENIRIRLRGSPLI
jgi:hypothetical protein